MERAQLITTRRGMGRTGGDKTRDIQMRIDPWIKSVESNRILQGKTQFSEATTVYAAVWAAWPGEQRTMHW